MTPKQVIDYFGRGLPPHRKRRITADRLGLTTAAINYWVATGRVPLKAQARIERMTKGELKLKV